MKKTLVALLIVFIFTAAATGFLASGCGNEDKDGIFSDIESLFNNKTASPEAQPDLDPDAWNMKLVNPAAPLSGDFDIATGITADGYLFDARAIPALDEMLRGGREAGMQFVLTSAYRTYDYQDMLFQEKIALLMDERGMTRADAEKSAAKEVARPGTSEHNLGLAADIVCEYYNILDKGYEDTAEAKWLRENCADYGFILRYDKGKEAITQIIYEPWHFRYVGQEAAAYIMENDLCLEEFLALYE
jgi:D-alanyl-D-alanine carboxypeptidase